MQSHSKRLLKKAAERYDSVFLNNKSVGCALLAAGGVVDLTMKVCRGELENGLAVVRPPGHHAECGCAMGFCLFNNVAVAAQTALDLSHEQHLGINKVLIVDWDVHHGNGTQDCFWDSKDVLMFSIHRHDDGTFYPGGRAGSMHAVGGGLGKGHSINVPWETQREKRPPGDVAYQYAVEQILLPVCEEFQPDLVLISAGYDAVSILFHTFWSCQSRHAEFPPGFCMFINAKHDRRPATLWAAAG